MTGPLADELPSGSQLRGPDDWIIPPSQFGNSSLRLPLPQSWSGRGAPIELDPVEADTRPLVAPPEAPTGQVDVGVVNGAGGDAVLDSQMHSAQSLAPTAAIDTKPVEPKESAEPAEVNGPSPLDEILETIFGQKAAATNDVEELTQLLEESVAKTLAGTKGKPLASGGDLAPPPGEAERLAVCLRCLKI